MSAEYVVEVIDLLDRLRSPRPRLTEHRRSDDPSENADRTGDRVVDVESASGDGHPLYELESDRDRDEREPTASHDPGEQREREEQHDVRKEVARTETVLHGIV